jgi:F-type H+-transporting ATPase subunit a
MSYLSAFFEAFKEKFLAEISFGNIGEEIVNAIAPKTLFMVRVGGYDIRITDAIVATWAVMVVIAALAWYFGHNIKRIPDTKHQQVAESLVGLLMKLCQSANMTYEQSEHVAPFVGTIAIFIGLTNLASMFKVPPPAKNPAFPIALALFTVCYVIGMSIRIVGFKGFWRSLIYPRAMLLPFKLLDYLIKPVSLSLRLFGNIFGAFILMEFIYVIIPAFVPGLIGLWFDLADGILQGMIFSYLTITYISEVIEGAHHANEEKAIAGEARKAH